MRGLAMVATLELGGELRNHNDRNHNDGYVYRYNTIYIYIYISLVYLEYHGVLYGDTYWNILELLYRIVYQIVGSDVCMGYPLVI